MGVEEKLEYRIGDSGEQRNTNIRMNLRRACACV